LLVGVALIGTGQMLTAITVQDLVGRSAAPEHRTTVFSWLALARRCPDSSGRSAPVSSSIPLVTRAAFAIFSLVDPGADRLALRLWPTLPAAAGQRSHDDDRPFFDLFREPGVRNILLTSTLISMSWDLQTFMVPVHGTRVGLSASQIGLVLGSFGGCHLLGPPSDAMAGAHLQAVAGC